MSMGEIIIILIVAVLVLGPEKLPSTAVQIAKILKALKRQVDDAKESIEKEIRVSEIKKEADKYKNEFSEYNQNIRKKLSFEEFDELKKEIVADTNAIKDDINAIEKDLASLGNGQNAENSVNSSEKSAINAKNSAQSVASKASKSAKTATKAQANIKAQENTNQANAKVQAKTNTAKAQEKAGTKTSTAKKPKTKIEQDNV